MNCCDFRLRSRQRFQDGAGVREAALHAQGCGQQQLGFRVTRNDAQDFACLRLCIRRVGGELALSMRKRRFERAGLLGCRVGQFAALIASAP